MAVDFKLPDLGEGVHEGQVVRVFIKPGETVREDEPLMEVETDKAAVVIPSPHSGVVEKVHVRDGQMVHVGDVMVTFGKIAEEKVTSTSAPAASVARSITATDATATASRAKPQAAVPLTPPPQHPPRRNPASPAVRKLARSLDIDIETIKGTGPGGRVQRSDVEAMSRQVPLPLGEGFPVRAGAETYPRSHAPSLQPSPKGRGSPAGAPRGHGGGERASLAGTPAGTLGGAIAARVAYPAVPESIVVEPQGEGASDAYGPVTIGPLSQTRKTIAHVMSQSWTTIPHTTDFDDADVTELDKIRKGYVYPDDPRRKLTMLAFVIRAVVRALQRFPEFNASIDVEKNQVIYKRYINIAVGVHTERGLVPMVVRDADRMSIPQISDALNIISDKARTATFSVNDTRGGTYTISNAGAMGGSRYSTPLITPPQVAVLAIGRTRWMPWVMQDESAQTRGLAPRLILPLSHSIDHRLLDGGQEVQFMQHVIGDLQNPARLLL